jgi:hypothetical protein
VSDTRQDPERTEFAPARIDAISAERSFVVGAHTWTVCEVIDTITLTRVLIFAGTGVGRRVRNYPSNWRELSSEALYKLSWER